MKALEWNRLTEITKNQKPYRGTTNRFPIGDRRHNTKCFYIEERNGEKVYVITYGTAYREQERTKAEYEADKANIYERITGNETKYVSYYSVPRELGIVRDDNTFEFTGHEYGYGQGTRNILTSWSRGYFFNSSRHGGMVYSERGNEVFHPIFQGLRINTDTMQVHESSHYQVIGKRVNRKEASQFLDQYKDFYVIAETMCKALDMKSFLDVGVEIAKTNELNLGNWYLHADEKEKLIASAQLDMNIAPLDALVAYAIATDTNSTWARVRNHVNPNNYGYYNREQEVVSVFNNVKRKINKELYKSNPSVMKTIEHEMGKYYAPSEWSNEIYVNGKEVEQY